jgi:hypothetical protein
LLGFDELGECINLPFYFLVFLLGLLMVLRSRLYGFKRRQQCLNIFLANSPCYFPVQRGANFIRSRKLRRILLFRVRTIQFVPLDIFRGTLLYGQFLVQSSPLPPIFPFSSCACLRISLICPFVGVSQLVYVGENHEQSSLNWNGVTQGSCHVIFG